jgi:2-polyprenyl-3-methyl-5-hydroxy-6-metoxy-1,4-benzoquinol methylase
MNDDERRQAESFSRLDYEGFRRLATQEGLSRYQRIGFPDSVRAGREPAIFADIRSKLPRLDEPEAKVLDIGPGCGDLPRLLIQHAEALRHQLVFVDSEEMLSALPDEPFLRKLLGSFPGTASASAELAAGLDVIICYSVLQYIFVEAPLFGFLDCALRLLKPTGGAMLIGDIPNVSMRRRFLASAAGAAFHRTYTGRDEDPDVTFNVPSEGQIDDAVVAALVARARAAGVDAWVMPQPPHLPMANRREDILLRRP